MRLVKVAVEGVSVSRRWDWREEKDWRAEVVDWGIVVAVKDEKKSGDWGGWFIVGLWVGLALSVVREVAVVLERCG